MRFGEFSDVLRKIAILVGQLVGVYAMAVNRPFGRLGWFLLTLALAGWPTKE